MDGNLTLPFSYHCKRAWSRPCGHGNGSDKGIHTTMKTLHMLHIDEGENLVSIQLLVVTKIASHAQNLSGAYYYIDIVDINMGCPVNKIVKTRLVLCGLRTQTRSLIINKCSISPFWYPLSIAKCVQAGSIPSRKCPAAEGRCFCPAMQWPYTWEMPYTGHVPLRDFHSCTSSD